MESIGVWLSHLSPSSYLTGLAVSLGLGWVVRHVPLMLGKKAAEELRLLISKGDAADRDLILALVKWAEAKLPAPGVGDQRYKLVSAKIVQLFPWLKGQEQAVADLIENAVADMESEVAAIPITPTTK